jgi:hypothetical protein
MNEHEEIAKALKARLSELRTRNTRPRVPVTKANRQGIVDPLTALLFSAAAAGEGLSQEARARAGGVLKALLVDGEASFSTDGTIKGDYPMPTTFTSKIVSKAESSDVTMVLEEGNVKELAVTPPPSSDLVVNYEPIAGHRANIPLVKYLSEGREIEIALAPIAGMRLLAPFRLSVVSTLANLVIEANRFETIMAPAPEGTPPIAHPVDTSSTRTRRDGVLERCAEARSGVVVCQEVPKPAPERP